MNNTVQQAYDKYIVGLPLTDSELKALHKYYKDLEKALKPMYQPKYALVQADVRNHLQTLEGYIAARKEK